MVKEVEEQATEKIFPRRSSIEPFMLYLSKQCIEKFLSNERYENLANTWAWIPTP